MTGLTWAASHATGLAELRSEQDLGQTGRLRATGGTGRGPGEGGPGEGRGGTQGPAWGRTARPGSVGARACGTGPS